MPDVTRHVHVDDLFELRLVDEPQVNPAGTQIIFTVTGLNKEDNAYRSNIWRLDFTDRSLVQLTGGSSRDSKPQWSPDGASIAFLSDRGSSSDGEKQIYCFSAGGGEPAKLTSHHLGIDMFEWSPDGQRMLFVGWQRKGLSSEVSESDVRTITSPRFRSDGSGFLDDRWKQIFLLGVATGEIKQITDGAYDHVQATWSPNGSEIVFVSNRRLSWEFSSVRDLYLAKVESGVIRQLTDGDGRWSLPSWSPDGSRLASLGTRNLNSASPNTEIFVTDLATNVTRSITDDHDLDFRDSSISDWNGYTLTRPGWVDAETIQCVAGVGGNVPIMEVNVTDGSVKRISVEDGHFGYPQALVDGSVVATYSSFCQPGEVVLLGETGTVESLTDFNRSWLESVALSSPEPIPVTSPDGVQVPAWLMVPAGLETDDRAPLLVEVHGGPFGMYANSFMHEFHLLAGSGYAVLFTNPRGSAGYGERYAGSLLPEMGENDLPDIVAALDVAIENPCIDRERVGILGGSYGGFLTNWLVAKTDRFKAAVTQRTISDWFLAWGTDDIFFADENTTMGATPWEDPELFFRISPITYVDDMDAPMLILHSEDDYRCPMSQAESLFTALKRLGRTTELIRFPDESHGLSRSGQPAHRCERLQHILRWFESHL